MAAEHDLPPALHALAGWMQGREPAIRFKVGALRAMYPYEAPDQLADRLLADFRGRVVKTGAVTSAIGVIPGLSTLVELGALGAQGAYAIKQEIEMVMAIAIAYGHDLTESEDRLVEVLAVAGLVTGSNLVRDRVLVEGGRRVAGERLAKASAGFAGRVGGHAVGRVAGRMASTVGRLVPLGIGVGIGVSFDWFGVTALGKAAKRYYGPSAGAHTELPKPGNVVELPPASEGETR
jgi:hypothetical protein